MFTYPTKEQALERAEKLTRKSLHLNQDNHNRKLIGFQVTKYTNYYIPKEAWLHGIQPIWSYNSKTCYGGFIPRHHELKDIML